jgi:hypothetical protein
MLLAFAPFIVFAVLSHFVAPTIALVAGALVSLGSIVRETSQGRSPKMIELGTCMLFGCLAIYAYMSGADWPVIGVKLAVDIGLLVIVLFSLLIGRPFTVQYARESVPPELWDSPRFVSTNRIITLVWLAAFMAIVAADLILLYLPTVPHRVSVLLTIGALYGAFKFTMTYLHRAKTH